MSFKSGIYFVSKVTQRVNVELLARGRQFVVHLGKPRSVTFKQ